MLSVDFCWCVEDICLGLLLVYISDSDSDLPRKIVGRFIEIYLKGLKYTPVNVC